MLSTPLSRPGYGTLGKPLVIHSNFFHFDFQQIHVYSLTTTPELPPLLSRTVLQALDEQIFNCAPILDLKGGKLVWSKRKLFEEESKRYRIMFETETHHWKVIADDHINTNSITVRLDNAMNLVDSERSLKIFLETVLRNVPSLNWRRMGNSFFSPKNRLSLSNNVECWRGYHASLETSHNKIYLNLDISATPVIDPGPVLDFLMFNLQKQSPDNLSEAERQRFEKLMKGLKICITHRGSMRKQYRVESVSKYNATEMKISDDSVTIQEYFKSRYNIPLLYPRLNLLQVGKSGNSIYLPIEICEITAGNRHVKKLSEVETAKMIKVTCQDPLKRCHNIHHGLEDLGLNNNRNLNDFNIILSKQMTSIKARVLEAPFLSFHPSSSVSFFQPEDGTWNLRHKRVAVGGLLDSWGVICFGSPKDLAAMKIEAFLRELIGSMTELGIEVMMETPPFIYWESGAIESGIRTIWAIAGQRRAIQPKLILCLLQSKSTYLYSELKRVCDTIFGVASQCVQGKHVFSPRKQYCVNLGLKINSKLGGMNTFLTANQLPFLSNTPAMIFGCDILQPPTGDASRPSLVALVGTMDTKANIYCTTVHAQSCKEEIVLELTSMVRELLLAFYRRNNRLKPFRLLFYRDGVSKSNAARVANAEVSAIYAACQSLEEGYHPRLSFVVLRKSHHARFFTTRASDADPSGNIPCGTVIDDTVTSDKTFDFYLCSHAGLQGTSRPTHYTMMFDSNRFTPDAIQELTFRLCFLYARCLRSVSVVTPVYYARLCAIRARFYVTETLCNKKNDSIQKVPEHLKMHFM